MVYAYNADENCDNDSTPGTLELRRVNYIPANCGVVLLLPKKIYNEENWSSIYTGWSLPLCSKVGYDYYSISEQTTATGTECGSDSIKLWTLYNYKPDNDDDYKYVNDTWNNYLIGTLDTAIKEKVIYCGVANSDSTKYTARNFFLQKYSNCYNNVDPENDYISFFRVKDDGTAHIDENKAYLQLPASVLNVNAQILKHEEDDVEYNSEASFSKMSLWFDDEEYGMGGQTTAIKDIATAAVADDAPQQWYTLQGTRISQPTQRGIYINGNKKVFVK